MKASSTVLGRVPAKLSTRVISMRSMFILLSADEIVKPPIRSMIVGENIVEKTYLRDSVSRIIEGGGGRGKRAWSRLVERVVYRLLRG